MRRLAAALVLVLAACGGDAERKRNGPAEIAEALRGGGYVIYLRHAATDHSQKDKLGVPLSDCSGQRNLNETGRAQAREIGEALRALEIPIGRVLASRYCRTRETAQLAFGRVTPFEGLTGLPEDETGPLFTQRVRALKTLLSDEPEPGKNTVLVGHIVNLKSTTQVEIEEGDAAIFEPLGGHDFRLVGEMPASVWPQLVGRVETTAARASRSNGFSRYG